MTDRERLILFTLLKQLKAMKSQGPVQERVLLYSTDMLVPHMMKSEFDAAIGHCDREGWAIGVDAVAGRKWKLSDAGEVALIELKS